MKSPYSDPVLINNLQSNERSISGRRINKQPDIKPVEPPTEIEIVQDNTIIGISEFSSNKKFSKAVKIVTKSIKEDEDLRRAYVANIAMAFYDECNRKGLGIAHNILHDVCNTAAEHFIDVWISSD